MINYKTHLNNTNKQWVTFVHGAGGSLCTWNRQIEDFKQYYNILLIDLRGHGDSNAMPSIKKKYTFNFLSQDIINVLNHLNIKSSHFIGVSMGTIFIRELAEIAPNMVKSMVQGGTILRFDKRAKSLILIGNIVKYIVPYILLYKFCAYILMPKKGQDKARSIFIREAGKMCQREFIKWFNLNKIANSKLRSFRNIELNIPTLYISGERDHLFLPTIKSVAEKHYKIGKLVILKKCGHVVNIEKPKVFNKLALDFIEGVN